MALTAAFAALVVGFAEPNCDKPRKRSFFLPNLNADMTQLLSATVRFATFAKTKMENDDAA